MTTEEILQAATPRPWMPARYGTATLRGNGVAIVSCGGWSDSTRDVTDEQEANAALVELAVNAYERDQATIKALKDALLRLHDGHCEYADAMAGKYIENEQDFKDARARERIHARAALDLVQP